MRIVRNRVEIVGCGRFASFPGVANFQVSVPWAMLTGLRQVIRRQWRMSVRECVCVC